ncbi:MAG: hypothetical protein ACYCZQ_15235 [Burkholderiales bacterium]
MLCTRQRFVSFLLTIFLANMLAWSFGSEALADWVTEEHAAVMSNVSDAMSGGPADSRQTEQTCNHGCHAVNHFQGQVSESLSFAVPTVAALFLNESFFLPLGIAQRQFRPPKLSSQA